MPSHWRRVDSLKGQKKEENSHNEYKAKFRITFKNKDGEIISLSKNSYATISQFNGKIICSTIRGMFVISQNTLEECFEPIAQMWESKSTKFTNQNNHSIL